MCSWKMMRRFALAACIFLLSAISVFAQQKKWDGGGGDSLFTTAANWIDDLVPLSSDSILLDNSIISSSYVVQLPAGNTGVGFSHLKVHPGFSTSISFVIPKTNTAIPALNCSGGIVLEEGARLQNSSGAASGNAISITDSLYVFNGASYIHNTDIGHASLITRLAAGFGTENGTVEFNVPGTASYTLSVSNRVYGNLILNATASGGARTYISTGVNPLLIKGNCIINAGATYSLNFSGEFSVQKSLQVNGIFNISTGNNSNSIKVKGDIVDGTITESGTGSPVLVLDGMVSQQLGVKGQISNSITLKTNNLSGILLISPILINHKLEMVAGKISTTDSTLLIISSSGSIVADSTQASVFVNGPLRKQGAVAGSYFLFPVGAGSVQRWLRIQEAVGDYIVSFVRNSANSISSLMDSSLHHVSNLEYWKVQALANQSGKLELSFNDVNSGGVTELSSLRVAQSQGAEWKSAGASAFSGSAGAAGSVLSDTVHFDQTGIYYFSLGSATANQNPLPLRTAILYLEEKYNALYFSWQINPLDDSKNIEIQESVDGILFRTVSMLEKGERIYVIRKPASFGKRYFRLLINWKDGVQSHSAIRIFSLRNEALQLNYLYPVVAHDLLQLSVVANKSQMVEFRVLDLQGNLIHKHLFFIGVGGHKITLPIGYLRAGQYQIFGLSSGLYTKPLRFIKS
ncbi:MAG: hypothetical protein IPP79_17475 [Chitinophagaceae bacterium]|nr:hypothetical protein [Chitinophagaceae bacterium]